MQLYFHILCLFSLTCSVFSQASKDSLDADGATENTDIITIGDRNLTCMIFTPPGRSAVPGLILIHEEWGVTDWVKSISASLANEGYMVIVPDLLSGLPDSIHPDQTNEDVIRKSLLSLEPEQVLALLDETYQFLKNQPSCNGKIGVIGFSWGGSQVFKYLVKNQELSAGFVFYGASSGSKKELTEISSPVYAIYGEYDSQINSTIRATEKMMKKLGKTFEYHIIDGGGHGFMRSGAGLSANEENVKARTAGWNLLVELLSSLK